ncbi:unnamed protein product, partial [Didymodactylos carnosus]
PFTPVINDTVSQENKALTAKTAEEIVKFMREGWKLRSPQLIISVTGGAQLFEWTSPSMENAFQKGLTSAAVTTGDNNIH